MKTTKSFLFALTCLTLSQITLAANLDLPLNDAEKEVAKLFDLKIENVTNYYRNLKKENKSKKVLNMSFSFDYMDDVHGCSAVIGLGNDFLTGVRSELTMYSKLDSSHSENISTISIAGPLTKVSEGAPDIDLSAEGITYKNLYLTDRTYDTLNRLTAQTVVGDKEELKFQLVKNIGESRVSQTRWCYVWKVPNLIVINDVYINNRAIIEKIYSEQQ